ncbi:nucleotide sugar dehydrogenase [Rhodococcus sp. X156]|uniref:nucleotide sugar dehydrogenase n=1 Tax=Rhodococcus sp. X156 TaxID=2499145 RepID=UPI001F49A165|nr:nucleotide sugar dehydrogenase [Rhodococcus sp. X156]
MVNVDLSTPTAVTTGSRVVPPVSPPGGATTFTYDVAVVGLGYVGLPTALAFHHAGDRVVGIDLDPQRLHAIARGQVDLLGADQDRLAVALADPELLLTDQPWRLREAAAVIICVPTPVDAARNPDLRALRRACAALVQLAVPGQTLVLTSTSYAGCTRDLLVDPLRVRGLVAGQDVFVAFSPERIDPGNARYPQEQVTRVVGGASAGCTVAAAGLVARAAGSVHEVDSLEVAEMAKLVENTFRAVNIALANEFADVCATVGVDVSDVIDAAATKPYGFMPFYPGPGVGGECIPCDPHYLLWQLRRQQVHAPLISAAMTAIARRPSQVVERVAQTLRGLGHAVRGARVLVVGVTYKPDVADVRESPALAILAELSAAGAVVSFYDPLITSVGLADGSVLTGVADPAAVTVDVAVLHTAHSSLDLGWLTAVPGVVDTTYRLDGVPHRDVP